MSSSSLSEFQLISRYFERSACRPGGAGVVLGIGDDAAILAPPQGQELLVSVDTLVSGVHFPEGCAPYIVGWRSLAVNLSDIAAMGASPLWFTLALTLPDSDSVWLAGFSKGLFAIAEQYGISLVGGDTTRGPLSITIQVHGSAPAGKTVRRSGANVGDAVYVTGSLGEAAAALALTGHREQQGEGRHRQLPETVMARFYTPEPRIAFGLAVRDMASAALDISDGLLSDLGHILSRSGVGARIHFDKLPYSADVADTFGQRQAKLWAASGGDDYELCFCAAPAAEPDIMEIAKQQNLPVTRIGRIVARDSDHDQTPTVLDERGQVMTLDESGYDHFD